jgi:hypothetical protein
MFRTLASAGALALAAIWLAGCTAATQTAIDNDIQTFNGQVANHLPIACALLSTADASFQTIAATGKLSKSAVADESAAMAGVNSICANPQAVNAATALQTLASAYAAIVESSKPN